MVFIDQQATILIIMMMPIFLDKIQNKKILAKTNYQLFYYFNINIEIMIIKLNIYLFLHLYPRFNHNMNWYLFLISQQRLVVFCKFLLFFMGLLLLYFITFFISYILRTGDSFVNVIGLNTLKSINYQILISFGFKNRLKNKRNQASV